MQLRLEQLSDQIQARGLLPIYLISGDEPLQLNEATDLIRHKAKQQGAERTVLDASTDFNWQRLIDESNNMSLFANSRLLDLRLGSSKPGREGGKILSEYATQFANNNILLITSNKLEKQSQKSKWYQALDKIGASVQVWPIEVDKLPNWIQQRVKKHNKHIVKDAAQLLADSVEGNLLAASQEIERLCLAINNDEISADDVISSVTDSARFDVFSLIECAYAGEAKRLVRMLDGLKNEGLEPMAIYGALMWDYRRLCVLAEQVAHGTPLNQLFSAYRIWGNKRKQAIQSILNRYATKQLYKLLQQANAIDRTIKSSAKHQVWDSLLLLLLSLAGYPVLN